jgi:hypothetical protein
MKSKIFSVPPDLMVQFADELLEMELKSEITGTTDDEVLITVFHTDEEREAVYKLIAWLDDQIPDEEDEEESDEDEEDEEESDEDEEEEDESDEDEEDEDR